jgi:hypothetical protein
MEEKIRFGNILKKLKGKTEWNIISGSHKVGTLRKEGELHYLYLDKNFTFSIEELQEIIDICNKKIGRSIK